MPPRKDDNKLNNLTAVARSIEDILTREWDIVIYGPENANVIDVKGQEVISQSRRLEGATNG